MMKNRIFCNVKNPFLDYHCFLLRFIVDFNTHTSYTATIWKFGVLPVNLQLLSVNIQIINVNLQ